MQALHEAERVPEVPHRGWTDRTPDEFMTAGECEFGSAEYVSDGY